MDPTLPQVLAALCALFSNSSDTKNATLWLESFQRSPAAWTLVSTLLSDPTQPPEYRLFCAQTLRLKIELDLNQVPLASHGALKDSLLRLLATGSQRAITRLICIALADLAVQMEWSDPVGDVLVGGLEAAVYLEFLRVLPEEVYCNRKLTLDDVLHFMT